jgi:hypothetical protein
MSIAEYNTGLKLFQSHQYQEAESYFSKATNLNPLFTIAFFMKGLAQYHCQNYEQSIESYTTCMMLFNEQRVVVHDTTYLYICQVLYNRAVCFEKIMDQSNAVMDMEAYAHFAVDGLFLNQVYTLTDKKIAPRSQSLGKANPYLIGKETSSYIRPRSDSLGQHPRKLSIDSDAGYASMT